MAEKVPTVLVDTRIDISELENVLDNALGLPRNETDNALQMANRILSKDSRNFMHLVIAIEN